ncbi:MAG: M20/M25/M40 family metallo-hydrolase [Bdellovibrionota bacterium]
MQATKEALAAHVDVERVLELLKQLIALPSVNPNGYTASLDEIGEHRVVGFLEEFIRGCGFASELEEVSSGRSNVYCLIPSREQRPPVGIIIHTDTVHTDPAARTSFCPEVRDGRVYGRGAVDNKAFIAIVLAMIEAMGRNRMWPLAPLLLMFVVDEERFGTGAAKAKKWVEQHHPNLGWLIVAEPTMNTPGFGHNGVLRGEFRFIGESAHASSVTEGHDANRAAIRAAACLESWLQGNARSWKGAHSVPTMRFTQMRGGTGPNVISGEAALTVDMRLTEKMSAAELRELVPHIVKVDVGHHDREIQVEWNVSSCQDASFQDGGELLQLLSAASGNEPVWLPFGTDWARMRGAAKQTIVFGPGSIREAHTFEEYIEVDEIERTLNLIGALLMSHGPC